MRIGSVMPKAVPNAVRLENKKVEKVSNNFNDLPNDITLIAFKGNDGLHDVKHGISVSVEDNIIGLPMYKCGGQGSVAAQLPQALEKYAGMRMPHIVPYYSYNNPKGEVKVLVITKEFDPKNLPDKMPENLFLSYPADKSLDDIAKMLNTSKDRVKFVVQDAPQSVLNAKTYKDQVTGEIKALKYSPYRILIPTNVQGAISRIDENSLNSLRTIPYRAYKMALPKAGGGYDTDSVICLHTTDFARFEKAYTYSPTLKDHPHLNLYTRDFCDAAVDMMPKLNTEDFNHLKPANVIAHCRTGFSTTESVINRSQADEFFRGFNVVDIFHNPMENYQGTSSNALDFLRYKATAQDYLKLSQMSEFPKLIELDSHRYNLNEEESQLVDRIIKPFLQYYIDDNGRYNHSITPLIARRENPLNIFPNHVSHTFANEVIIYDDIARGLTGKFRAANDAGDKIPGRPNGCNIDFMKINDPNAKMGNNSLSEDLSWYHPYDTKLDSAEKIVESKRANTKGFLDAVGKATETRLEKLGDYANLDAEDALNRLFFSKDDIAKNKYVLGGLSKFHEKDILWASWGRSDAQKGYPILLEGFRKYLADETVPEEIRLHSKLMIGSGSDPWPVDDRGVGDFHKIKDTIYKIQNMNDGKFKLNVMYSNGGISNRLVTCTTYTAFSSTGEPQGLTVPESLQSGTPSGSLNSGGAGEMIVTMKENADRANGFKTEHAYMQNLLDLEKQRGIKIAGEQIGDVRLDAASDEIALMFKDMALTYHQKPEVYKKMVLNAARSEFDWHNNKVLNNGRSTVQLYAEDAFQIQKGFEGRNKAPLKRIVGEFGAKIEEVGKNAIETVKETKNNIEKQLEEIIALLKQGVEAVNKEKQPVQISMTGLEKTIKQQAKTLKQQAKTLKQQQKDKAAELDFKAIMTQQIENLKTEVENYKQVLNETKNELKESASANKNLKLMIGAIGAFAVIETAIHFYIKGKSKSTPKTIQEPVKETQPQTTFQPVLEKKFI